MFLSRRDILKLSGAALLASAFSPAIRALADSTPPSVFSRGSARLPRVALTIDDCYLSHILEKMENALMDNPGMRVTFFPAGEALLSTESKLPGIWKRLAERGHDIGYHSFYHDNLQVFSNEDALRDYDMWHAALNKVLGKESRVYFARPPFGNVSPTFLTLCKQRGLVCTMWSWGWGGTDVKDTVTYTVPKTKNGDVVLMHTRTVDVGVLIEGLPWLKAQGMQAVTLRQLYYDFRKEQIDAKGCETSTGSSLTRTCSE
jgi:peptidoglycan/xylan/chitin deacetylase (PgdA/CDA1 family)